MSDLCAPGTCPCWPSTAVTSAPAIAQRLRELRDIGKAPGREGFGATFSLNSGSDRLGRCGGRRSLALTGAIAAVRDSDRNAADALRGT
jgi:hypothetical protein